MEWNKKPILEDWEIVVSTQGKADENTMVRVRGDVFGSDEFPNGCKIVTGVLEFLCTRKMVLRTKAGKGYRLGKIEEEFERCMKKTGSGIDRIRVREGYFINESDFH